MSRQIAGETGTFILSHVPRGLFPLNSISSFSHRPRNGSRICDRMGNLTRIMIGHAISMYPRHYPPYLCTNSYPNPHHRRPTLVVIFLAIVFILYAYRRRRINRANLAHIQETPSQRESGAAYGGPYGSVGGPTPFSPQRPTPAQNTFNSPYIYNTTTPVRESSLALIFLVHAVDALL